MPHSRKSYLRSRLVKRTRNETKARTPKHKAFSVDIEALQLACFNQKPSAVTQHVERATEAYVAEHLTKGKLKLSVLGSLSLYHILTYNTVFEHTYLNLLMADYLSTTDAVNLNKTSEVFTPFHKMILHAKPNIFLNYSSMVQIMHHKPLCLLSVGFNSCSYQQHTECTCLQ